MYSQVVGACIDRKKNSKQNQAWIHQLGPPWSWFSWKFNSLEAIFDEFMLGFVC